MRLITIDYTISRKDVKHFFDNINDSSSDFFKLFYTLECANDLKFRMESARKFFTLFPQKRFTSGTLSVESNFINVNAFHQLSYIPFFDNIFNKIFLVKQGYNDLLRPIETFHFDNSTLISESINDQLIASLFVSFDISNSDSPLPLNYFLSTKHISFCKDSIVIADYFKFKVSNQSNKNGFSLTYNDGQYSTDLTFFNVL